MKVGIVLNPYGEMQSSGLGRAAFEITRSIIEGNKNTEVIYEIFVKGKTQKDPGFNGEYTCTKLSSGFLWLDRGLLRRKDLDVVLFLTPFGTVFVRPKKSIVVVHDLALFHEGGRSARHLLLRFIYARSIKRAHHIVTVSNATMKDIQNLFGITVQHITRIYNGFTYLCKDSSGGKANVPFFVMIAVVKPRKNVLRVVEAFVLFKKHTNLPHKLVIGGKYSNNPYFQSIQNIIAREHIEKSVEFRGYVSDDEAGLLYKTCTASLYPTLFEGFGMTILEAMQCGAPVITSDRPAHKEAAGDAALLVDPEDADSIAGAMEKVATDEKERERLSHMGKGRAEMFHWEKTGNEYRTLLNNIMHD